MYKAGRLRAPDGALSAQKAIQGFETEMIDLPTRQVNNILSNPNNREIKLLDRPAVFEKRVVLQVVWNIVVFVIAVFLTLLLVFLQRARNAHYRN